MAQAMGHHAFHDLDELANDFYDDFWTEWLERPGRELAGSPVPYIAGAMMNKLRDLIRHSRSVYSHGALDTSRWRAHPHKRFLMPS